MVLRGRRKKAQFMALRRLVKAFPVQSMDGGGKTNSSFVIIVCAILAFVLLSLQVDG